MNEEQIKQKAEEYADTKVEDRKGYNARWELIRNAYIAGATEVTKELQEELEKWKAEWQEQVQKSKRRRICKNITSN